MHFASPIWLALLLPWAVLAAWLLWARHGVGTGVPFLDLWRGPVAPARTPGRFQTPPLALLALILASLLSVLAVARPIVHERNAPPRPTTTAPAEPRANVAITHVAAIDRPRAQVMVTVRNDSSEPHPGSLEVRSGAATVRREITLPARGREANFFVDLSALTNRVEVNLDAGDESGVDNRASLERQSASPHVEVRGDVPPEVRRVIEAYARARPAGEGGRVVACPPGTGEPGVIVAPDAEFGIAEPRDVRVVAHPVTRNLDLANIPMSISTSSPVGEGWTTLLLVGDKPIVAVRESPARQVWMGFSSRELAVTPAFVVLWTNAIDWVGETEQSAFVERVAGAHVTTPSGSAKRQAADAVTDAPADGARRDRELLSTLAFCALLCVFFASLVWSSSRRLTVFSVARTVI
jgi:hypothetical protein